MPKVEQKQVVVNEIKEKITKATSVVLLDSRGLTVGQDTALRKKLREAGVDYKVYKNSMVNFAVEGTVFEGLKDFLSGPTAVAICYEDPTAASRIINNEAGQLKNISFKAGVIDGVLYDTEGMKAVAGIPPRNELLSKLLGSFQAPMATFARVIQAIADKEVGSEA